MTAIDPNLRIDPSLSVRKDEDTTLTPPCGSVFPFLAIFKKCHTDDQPLSPSKLKRDKSVTVQPKTYNDSLNKDTVPSRVGEQDRDQSFKLIGELANL
jgi:hypothetical protein